MLKFIPGILILQGITIALVLLTPNNMDNWGLLRLAIPILIAAFLTAFWFGSIAARQRKDEISRLKESHAKERETIRLNAERVKTQQAEKEHRKILSATLVNSGEFQDLVGVCRFDGFGCSAHHDTVHVIGVADFDHHRWRMGWLYVAYQARKRQTSTATQRSKFIT